jgi:NAD(P)-dependent dehydrogenase (short-subunit alcohol dehydrogenase family)
LLSVADARRLNAICPGPTLMPLAGRYFQEGPDPEAERQRYEASMPIGRLIEPDEVAAAAFYLATHAARGITGSTLVIDGGYVVA